MNSKNKTTTNKEIKKLKKEVKQEYEQFLKHPEKFKQYSDIDELSKDLDS